MKILITGGNGFIAKNLSEQLGGEYAMSSPDRKELDLMDSLKVFDYIKKNKFDVVIHTATYDAVAVGSTKNPAKVLENNLKMFFNIARCQKYFRKMIYFGSGAEFDRRYWIPKMKEDYFDQHVPQDQYGFSKYLMTQYTLLNNKIYNLRLFGVFGKYDDWKTRIISNICYLAVMNLPIIIEQNKFYDFLYIDDLTKIVKWFIGNNPKKKVYNVCTANTIDFKTIAKKIVKISGKKLDAKIKTKGLGLEYSGDSTRLLNELKDFKFTPIDLSMKYLYNWYDQNKQNFFINSSKKK